ncbi:MAG: hypothetical protein ACREMY_16885 [bacterium]
MWASGVFDLGLDDTRFWSLTPREFDALWQRFLDREEREQQRFGLLAMMYTNVHRDRDKRPQPFDLDDFAPSRHGRAIEPATAAGCCPDCGLHESIGHLEECKRGRALLDYNLSQVAMFAKLNPDCAREVLINGE